MDQIMIAITGVAAIWLSQDKLDSRRKWACIFGMVGQPFWMYTTYQAEQWGIFILTFAYTAGWAKGIYNNWINRGD